MHYLLLFVALFSTPQPQADLVTSWGTHFIFDDQRVEKSYKTLYWCLDHVVTGCTKCYGDPEETLEQARVELLSCYYAHDDNVSIADNPPTYYGFSDEQKRLSYEEFDMCISGLASYMWDFPENYPVDSFRESVMDCQELYPTN